MVKMCFGAFWSDPKTRVSECFSEVLYCFCHRGSGTSKRGIVEAVKLPTHPTCRLGTLMRRRKRSQKRRAPLGAYLRMYTYLLICTRVASLLEVLLLLRRGCYCCGAEACDRGRARGKSVFNGAAKASECLGATRRACQGIHNFMSLLDDVLEVLHANKGTEFGELEFKNVSFDVVI